MTVIKFQMHILDWYATHKRSSLPWRPQKPVKVFSPYKVLVSEVMLQQTQVSRVLLKFDEFLRAFPTVYVLAKAPLSDVLMVWQGMGYNRRAKYLHEAAKKIVSRYEGKIPRKVPDLLGLPGIGQYTAGAIAAFAYNDPVVFIDTNIRKVYIHFFFKGKERIGDKEILAIAQKALWRKDPRTWHYALMDYGAIEIKKEKDILPRAAAYHRQSPFLGSQRYFRAKIVRLLLPDKSLSERAITAVLRKDPLFASHISVHALLAILVKEHLVIKKKNASYAIRA